MKMSKPIADDPLVRSRPDLTRVCLIAGTPPLPTCSQNDAETSEIEGVRGMGVLEKRIADERLEIMPEGHHRTSVEPPSWDVPVATARA